MSETERFFVTGGNGFFGAWIVRHLLSEGFEVAIFDVENDDHILLQVLDVDRIRDVSRFVGDVADPALLERAVGDFGATRVLHLAGLQVPACRSDPFAGARVNVLGTIGVLEAARRRRDRVRSVVYASSAAVAGPPADYESPIPDHASHRPGTHYGVFKLANEGNARLYWLEHGVPSVGLRPLTVYGVGREKGITSGPTKAIKAALLGRSFTIPFRGKTGFQYVEDVAGTFVACGLAPLEGARALNMRGEILDVEEFVRALDSVLPGAAARVTVTGGELPVAWDVVQTGLDELLGPRPMTRAEEGIRRTVERFRRLQTDGRLPDRDLET